MSLLWKEVVRLCEEIDVFIILLDTFISDKCMSFVKL